MTSQRLLKYNQDSFDKLTHYIFRYPAKFHPPIVRTLITQYSQPGHVIADPFCGSGTLMVEALTLGRHTIGTDVDPLAVFVSRVKTRLIPLPTLRTHAQELLRNLKELRRSEQEYVQYQFSDITEDEYSDCLTSFQLKIPPIPNINHWFRRYVIVDLARLRHAIQSLNVQPRYKDFFMLCFASIIRNASNADPVPVSGLEVTSYMRKRDEKGRVIDPFSLFERSLNRSLSALEQLHQQVPKSGFTARAIQADATRFSYHIRKPIDAVITSPPYHNAVDYYRRHTLEMYWLDLVEHRQDRLDLLPKYIGRHQVPQRHPFVLNESVGSTLAQKWEKRLRKLDDNRGNAFKHYAVAMRKSLSSISDRLCKGKPAIFVVGKSSWNGQEIPTVELFKELAADQYDFEGSYWYPLKNRYMTYSRKNGADINKEYVLVFKKK